MESEKEQLPPRDAARLYDFSESLLRRYAAVYERYGGKIGHDIRGGRVYTHELMRLFAEVKERVRENNETVEQAMTTITVDAGSDTTDLAQPVGQSEEALELLRRLVAGQETQQEVLEALRSLPGRLEHIIEERRQAAAKELEVLEQRLAALERPVLPAMSQKLEEPSPDIEDLRKMNEYLRGELERRRLAAEKPQRRAWWNWWSRG